MKLSTLIQSLDAGVSVNSENRPRKSGEYGVLKTSSVSYSQFRPEENKKIISSELTRARVKPKKDCIIISRMNTEQLVGASCYIDKDYGDLFLPDRLWQAVRATDNFSMKYLSLVIASRSFRQALSNISSGTSGSMKNIPKPTFLNLQIPLPPLDIQEKFVSEFGEEESIAESNKGLIDIYEKKIEALLDEVRGG